MRILYDSKNLEFKKPFGVLRENEECDVKIHIPMHCKTKEVKLELFRENGGEYATVFLSKQGEYDKYEIYSARFGISDIGLYFYRFYIITEEGEFPLYKWGYDMTNMCEGNFWQLSVIKRDFKTPEFFRGKTMYQIFPDRFYKFGSPNLEGKIQPYTIHQNLSDIPEYLPNEEGEVLNCDFFGGNFLGIQKKLPYLKSLGVSVIYLNPIFKAFSNHRYDTADYKKPDEMLGTEKDFARLCKAAHRHNIKIILDGVFSHTGSRSKYFDIEGVFGNGAYSNPDSPYREWFDFKSYPDDYTAWWGIKTLPCTNEMNESYIDYIIDSEDSVIAHWMRLGADGFRLDVADELPDEFIEKLRKRIKGINPDAILIGEVWEDASNKCSYDKRRKYFLGNELDGVMNYPFRNAILDFAKGEDRGDGLKNIVMTLFENYPRDVLNSTMLMLSTHDTERILTVLSSAQKPQSKTERAVFRLPDEARKEAEERLYLAVFLQFMLPGMPSIYYGDEILTEGYEDPFSRTFFDWQREKESLSKQFFKEVSKIRNKHKELLYGDISIDVIENGFVKIERRYENKSICAYLNNSSEPKAIPSGKIILSKNLKDGKIFGCGFALVK